MATQLSHAHLGRVAVRMILPHKAETCIQTKETDRRQKIDIRRKALRGWASLPGMLCGASLPFAGAPDNSGLGTAGFEFIFPSTPARCIRLCAFSANRAGLI
jgi:hypothetical protein